jgi:hypothetical protein
MGGEARGRELAEALAAEFVPNTIVPLPREKVQSLSPQQQETSHDEQYRTRTGLLYTTRRMQVGIAGLGAGAVQVIRAMANAPYIQLMAAADVRPEALAAFTSRFQGRTYASVEDLCRAPEVEVVWIST